MKILVTAFDPFGGQERNASMEILSSLDSDIGGAEICRAVLPTSFSRCGTTLEAAVSKYSPDAILCLGQAGGRAALTPERVAINVMDARIPDNDGAQPVDEPVVEGAPAAYFSTLPIRKMTEYMENKGVSAQISNTAGTFVCNCLMFKARHLVRESGVPCGFLHVPWLEGQGENAVSLDTAVLGVSAAIEAIADSLR